MNTMTNAQAYRAGFEGLVLAAGEGSRFAVGDSTDVPKVLYPLLQKPMIDYVLDALEGAGIHDITVVVGHMAQQVQQWVGSRAQYAAQDRQNGSGHAVASARERFADFAGHLVVLCGDSPLFKPKTIVRLMRRHVSSNAVMTLASAELPNPDGYGRILRDDSGQVTQVVEESCASDEQRRVREVNGGAYVFDSRWLFENIDRIERNSSGEYNLTDMVRVAAEQGRTLAAHKCDTKDICGVNSPDDVAAAQRILRRRQRPWKKPDALNTTNDQEED